jgi:hypothetical protein
MATQPTLDDFRFGFEYETLVGVKDDLLSCGKIPNNTNDQNTDKNTQAQVQTNKDGKQETKKAKKPSSDANRYSHATRCLLASAINLVSKIQVKVDCGDVQKAEKPAEEPAEKPAEKSTENTWMLTSDFSVGISDKTKGSPVYSSFLDLLTPSSPSPPSTIINYIEFVSPILTIKDVKDTQPNLQSILDTHFCCNKYFSYWNNVMTSNHVHVSLEKDLLRDPQILFKVVMAWWYFEPVFMIMVSNDRRSNGYCAPMRDLIHEGINNLDTFSYLNYELFTQTVVGNNDILQTIITMFQGGMLHTNRYAAFNMLNLLPGGIGTIEFRLKHGSSSGEENANWIIFLLCFILSVIRRPCISDQLMNGNFTLMTAEELWNLYDPNNETETLFEDSSYSENNTLSIHPKFFNDEGLIPYESLVKYISNGLTDDAEKTMFKNSADYFRDIVALTAKPNSPILATGGKKTKPKPRLEKETVEQLKKRCAKKKLSGYSHLRKAELICLLRKDSKV